MMNYISVLTDVLQAWQAELEMSRKSVKSRTFAVTILGRHFMSTKDALRKSRPISTEEAQKLVTDETFQKLEAWKMKWNLKQKKM
jgi:hypothetical protein